MGWFVSNKFQQRRASHVPARWAKVLGVETAPADCARAMAWSQAVPGVVRFRLQLARFLAGHRGERFPIQVPPAFAPQRRASSLGLARKHSSSRDCSPQAARARRRSSSAASPPAHCSNSATCAGSSPHSRRGSPRHSAAERPPTMPKRATNWRGGRESPMNPRWTASARER